MKKLYILIIMLSLVLLSVQQAYADSFKITVSPLSVDFYIEDINGNVSGYYPPSGFIVGELPYMNMYKENFESDVDNPLPNQQWHELRSKVKSLIPTGKYKLVVFDMNITTETEINIGIYRTWSNMGSAYTAPIDHIFPGLTYTYEFDIPVVPPANYNDITFIKVSNPQDMITEIKAFAKAGRIGNAKFVDELIKEIQEIEKERLKPAEKDDKLTPAQKAKKEYQELMDEIDEKNAKPEKDEYVHDIAAMLLRRDIDYIINHIQ